MMKLRTVHSFAVALLVGTLVTSCGTSSENVSPERWVLTMSDEFEGDNGTPPSPELWTIETGYGSNGWGNDEWQLYTDSADNLRVEDGNLVITAQCPVEPCEKRDGSITSARIKTQVQLSPEKGFEQQHGRIEASIKLPEGAGFWPAFWMLGANIDEVPWPGCGEIDIMEYQGQRPERAFGTLHGPGYSGGDSISRDFFLPDGETFADGFHLFAVEWDPGRIAFSVDGEVYGIVRSSEVVSRGDWVFNNEFFMILNLAVGGSIGGPVGPDTVFPADVLVDYVRVYERAK